MTGALLALSLTVISLPAVNPTCPASEPAPGAGVLDPFHVPQALAAQLNADGKVLYRQGRWDDARQKYRAALASDPDFLAPALNIACSFVRQERFSEAVAEVLRLVDSAYLPWSREVISAADLGALKIRNEGKQLQTALDAARLRWADGVSGDLILIARMRSPLKLGEFVAGAIKQPAGPQALVLGQKQEVFAWSPRTRRYRQLTSEDGRVLALARSADRRRIAYLTAEKLIRGDHGGAALRGLVITEMDLGTLLPTGRAPIQGDVRRVDVVDLPTGFAYRIEGSAEGSGTFSVAGSTLSARPVFRSARQAVALTGAGVTPGASNSEIDSVCGASARDIPPRDGKPPYVLVTPGRTHGPKISVGGPYGAGLNGLPIP